MCSVPKEATAEASKARVVTANLSATHAGVHGSAEEQPKVVSLSVVFIPDLVPGCGVERAGAGGQGAVAAGIEVVVLLSGTWTASVTGHSEDLPTPDPAPSCGVEWVEMSALARKQPPRTPSQGLSTQVMRFCGTAWCVC